MQLDHATIVTADLDTAQRFFIDVVGLTEGERPPFRIGGSWLYAEGRPLVHLIEMGASGASSTYTPAPAQPQHTSPRIDHIAFRLSSADEWQALLGRLEKAAMHYQLADVPQAEEVQLFVALAPAVVVEFVTARRHARR